MSVADALDQFDRTFASGDADALAELDAVPPVDASREILGALPRGLGRLEVIAGAGHFPWLDVPERYWPLIETFIATPDRATT